MTTDLHKISDEIFRMYMKELEKLDRGGETLKDIVGIYNADWRDKIRKKIEEIIWENAHE